MSLSQPEGVGGSRGQASFSASLASHFFLCHLLPAMGGRGLELREFSFSVLNSQKWRLVFLGSPLVSRERQEWPLSVQYCLSSAQITFSCGIWEVGCRDGHKGGGHGRE